MSDGNEGLALVEKWERFGLSKARGGLADHEREELVTLVTNALSAARESALREAWDAWRDGVAAGEKLAGLRDELRRAKRHREKLDLPLSIRERDEPRKERIATPEEVAEWKAGADAKVRELELRITQLELRIEPPPAERKWP